MPIYIYECEKGHRTEEEHPITDQPEEVACAECGRPARKIIAASGAFCWKAGGGKIDPELAKRFNEGR